MEIYSSLFSGAGAGGGREYLLSKFILLLFNILILRFFLKKKSFPIGCAFSYFFSSSSLHFRVEKWASLRAEKSFHFFFLKKFPRHSLAYKVDFLFPPVFFRLYGQKILRCDFSDEKLKNWWRKIGWGRKRGRGWRRRGRGWRRGRGRGRSLVSTQNAGQNTLHRSTGYRRDNCIPYSGIAAGISIIVTVVVAVVVVSVGDGVDDEIDPFVSRDALFLVRGIARRMGIANGRRWISWSGIVVVVVCGWISAAFADTICIGSGRETVGGVSVDVLIGILVGNAGRIVDWRPAPAGWSPGVFRRTTV